MHNGVSNGEKLLSICNCDPCCCLWRVAPFVAPKIGSKVKMMSGIEIQVTDKCIGCGTCTKGVCFVNAIELINDRAVINKECRGCGRCIDICPQKAITLSIEDDNYVKKAIEEIERLIDVT
jgi:MinD superfamily P-loop ATPase